MLGTEGARVRGLEASPLSVPLREPFVIASARLEVTRAVLVQVTVERGGRAAVGWGEAAALPPVTREDQPELLSLLGRARSLAGREPSAAALDEAAEGSPVARAGIESAVFDALGRLEGVPLGRALGGGAPPVLRTDVTLPIAPAAHMAANARAWAARGFDRFKVKVGKDRRSDREALAAVHDAVPGASYRLDANEGFDAAGALALLDEVLALGLRVELFEQPCPRADLEAMAEVCRHAPVPVVADESVRTLADLEAVLRAGAARGVNLKLVKHGGPGAALAIGRRARAEGLGLMVGAMVETRLGLTAMAHVAWALGGADWVDLDTAFLLAGDPFDGGLAGDGPVLTLGEGAGLDIRPRLGPLTRRA